MTSIDCPVCDRPAVEAETCPNCEADLADLHMLARLPVAEAPAAPTPLVPPRRSPASLAIALIAAGVLTGGGGYLVGTRGAPSPQVPLTAEAPATPVPSPTVAPTSEAALAGAPTHPSFDGFRYQVRPGDSLWLIAKRFYGSGDRWPHLRRTRDGVLRPGEIVDVPNLPPPEAR